MQMLRKATVFRHWNTASNPEQLSKMKLAIAFLAIIGLVCALPHYRTGTDVKIADKAFLEKQKFLFEIVYRVEDPLAFEEWIKYGEKFIVDKSFYSYYDTYMEKFYHAYKMGALLPKGEFFGAFVKTHLKQALGLFNFFYYAKDWETFQHNVAWARIHANEGMFVFALTLAVIHRDDFQGFILPSIYEIFPQYFFNSKFIYEAEKFDYDTWSKYTQYEKEFYDVFYRNNKYFHHDYYYFKDYKYWQWWKLMGLGEYWYPEEKFMLRDNIYEFNQDPKWIDMMKDVKMFWMPVDYTRDIYFYNEESKLSYFTEDADWNAYWYYLNMDYGFFLDGKTFGLDKDRRVEFWFYNVQQILARYYAERLSNGFGYIPEFSFFSTYEYGYDPQLISYSGVGFTYRKNYWDIASYGNFELFNKVHSAFQRIDNVIATGFYTFKDGKTVDLYDPKAFEYFAGYFHNFDTFDKYFVTYWYMFSHMYFGGAYEYDFEAFPSCFLNFETTFRDPFAYVFYKHVFATFFKFKEHFKSYTHEELFFPGVEFKDVHISELTTYFDLYDFDTTNLLNDKAHFVDGKFVWDKSLFARQARLNHKPFEFEFTVNSDKAQKVVFRIFYAPKFDEFGHLISIADSRENFIKFDEFVYELAAGKNTFKRFSKDFYWTFDDRTTYTELYKYVMLAFEGKYDFPLDISEPHCAFPDRLILPHGWVEGYPVQFFFFIAPYHANYEQFSSFDYTYSCGIGSGVRYVDDAPFFYPFDRVIDEYEFFVPNMYFKDTKIYHEKTFDKYYDTSKKFTSFDYSFFNDYYTKYFK